MLKIFLICEYISKLHNELLANQNTLLHGKNDLDIKHALVLYLFQYCTKLSLIQKDLCITLQCSHFSSSQYCMDVGDSFTTFRDYWKRWKLLETLNRYFTPLFSIYNNLSLSLSLSLSLNFSCLKYTINVFLNDFVEKY